MNSDIRYLQLLEDDLREAAEIERELDAEAAAGAGRGRTGSGPRRLPRRGWNWGAAAAAIVALLVVAGGIGFLTQPGSQSASAPAFSPSATPAPRKLRSLIIEWHWLLQRSGLCECRDGAGTSRCHRVPRTSSPVEDSIGVRHRREGTSFRDPRAICRRSSGTGRSGS